ncbi:hypothetical protein EMA8858_00628 [Emticicia aquatica]|uniref:Outer membrane protein beta-barrel domain-containing protein n=1 Tax=Emticicia aquatica TaxID=1681835 RepID=A0ABN8ESF5_9BACT|nr:hypothetical protein [Emticicia aquatica]CAH0994518.1 hypothetical protein EMA8858_00628 [Emticicia aquatica]
MENFEDNIEKEYRRRFHDFEEMPDDSLWSKIQERIAPEEANRPIIFWWNNLQRIGIAASILLMLLVGGYHYSTIFTNQNIQTENKIITKSTQTEISRKSENSRTKFPNINKKTNIEDGQIGQNRDIYLEKTQLNLTKNTDEKHSEKKNVKLEQTLVGLFVTKSGQKKKQRYVDNETKEIQILPNENAENLLVKVESKITLAENAILEKIQSTGNGKIDKTEINQHIVFLSPRKMVLQVNEKTLTVPEWSRDEAQIAFEQEPGRKLVFIPPAEVFANVTPMLSYYVFSPNKSDNILVKDFNSSSDRLGFAAQFGFVYPIHKKLNLRTGLSFMTGKSKISYDLTNDTQKIVKVIDELNIEIEPTNQVNTERKNWKYVELQSDFLYEIKKFQALSLGFRAGIQTSALNKPVFNGRLGYRISKSVNDRVAVWLEPSVAISLSSQKSIENLFIYHTTGFGLNMGVSLLRTY